MKYGCLNKCEHVQNQGLWDEIDRLSQALELKVRANRTSTGLRFEGRTSYVILKSNAERYHRNSEECIFWAAAPYMKYFKPSISGEAAALQLVITKLKGLMTVTDMNYQLEFIKDCKRIKKEKNNG